MMTTHAYRCSDAFAEALREWTRADHEFRETVIVPMNDELGPNAPVFDAGPLWVTRSVVGFADDESNRPPPEGLSRSQKRTYLLPKRGRAGDAWRARLARLGDRPNLDKVFAAHGVPAVMMSQSRFAKCGIVDNGEHGVFVTNRLELPSGEHIEPVPLSAYYAATEAAQADRVAELEQTR